MLPTVAGLLDLDLLRRGRPRVVTGPDGLAAPVRWVHPTELDDPTPWLSGSELILTTGMRLKSEVVQREFVERLSSRHVAGVGFGTGWATV